MHAPKVALLPTLLPANLNVGKWNEPKGQRKQREIKDCRAHIFTETYFTSQRLLQQPVALIYFTLLSGFICGNK